MSLSQALPGCTNPASFSRDSGTAGMGTGSVLGLAQVGTGSVLRLAQVNPFLEEQSPWSFRIRACEQIQDTELRTRFVPFCLPVCFTMLPYTDTLGRAARGGGEQNTPTGHFLIRGKKSSCHSKWSNICWYLLP